MQVPAGVPVRESIEKLQRRYLDGDRQPLENVFEAAKEEVAANDKSEPIAEGFDAIQEVDEEEEEPNLGSTQVITGL